VSAREQATRQILRKSFFIAFSFDESLVAKRFSVDTAAGAGRKGQADIEEMGQRRQAPSWLLSPMEVKIPIEDL